MDTVVLYESERSGRLTTTATGWHPGLPAAEGGCPTRTGPLETGTDLGEMKGPGRSAVCERSPGI
jgi:hypothetical protein